RRTMDGEQTGERIDSDLSGLSVHRKPEELAARGQVADRKEVRVLSIDGQWRLGEVHGPDGAGTGPVQDVELTLAPLLVHPAEALEQVLEVRARHVGIAGLQCR